MEYVALVILITLTEYIVFGILVGRAELNTTVLRQRYPVIHVRALLSRAHEHLEQLLIFLPAIVIYGVYGNPVIAAAVGLVFPVSRVIYLQAYLSDPAKRGRGFCGLSGDRLSDRWGSGRGDR